MNAERPLVLVTVGTDHHPFNRLIEWIDRWLARQGETVDAVVQHGTAEAPRSGRAVAYLDHGDFLVLAGTARVVVSHGGPATIAECRRLGHLPIVVPRRPDLGEHVDGHQMRFADRLSAKGMIRVPRDEDALWRLLDDAVADPLAFELQVDEEQPGAVAARRFGELVAALPHKVGRKRSV